MGPAGRFCDTNNNGHPLFIPNDASAWLDAYDNNVFAVLPASGMPYSKALLSELLRCTIAEIVSRYGMKEGPCDVGSLEAFERSFNDLAKKQNIKERKKSIEENGKENGKESREKSREENKEEITLTSLIKEEPESYIDILIGRCSLLDKGCNHAAYLNFLLQRCSDAMTSQCKYKLLSGSLQVFSDDLESNISSLTKKQAEENSACKMLALLLENRAPIFLIHPPKEESILPEICAPILASKVRFTAEDADHTRTVQYITEVCNNIDGQEFAPECLDNLIDYIANKYLEIEAKTLANAVGIILTSQENKNEDRFNTIIINMLDQLWCKEEYDKITTVLPQTPKIMRLETFQKMIGQWRHLSRQSSRAETAMKKVDFLLSSANANILIDTLGNHAEQSLNATTGTTACANTTTSQQSNTQSNTKSSEQNIAQKIHDTTKSDAKKIMQIFTKTNNDDDRALKNEQQAPEQAQETHCGSHCKSNFSSNLNKKNTSQFSEKRNVLIQIIELCFYVLINWFISLMCCRRPSSQSSCVKIIPAQNVAEQISIQ